LRPGGNAILAAKASTTTIPIVFTFGGDPVKEGFVASLNRPGGNITGASFFGSVLGGKALALLQEVAPNAAVTALLVNPKNPARIERHARGGAHSWPTIARAQCEHSRDRDYAIPVMYSNRDFVDEGGFRSIGHPSSLVSRAKPLRSCSRLTRAWKAAHRLCNGPWNRAQSPSTRTM
jgi:hypothetical protein